MPASATSFDPADDLRVFRFDQVAERLSVSVESGQRLLDSDDLICVRLRKSGPVINVLEHSPRQYISGGAA